MAYYIRFLSRSKQAVSLARLRSGFKGQGLDTVLTVEAATKATWGKVLLAHPDGQEITVVERNPVERQSLGEKEIQEFCQDIEKERPTSAVHWLRSYLLRVKIVYAFQILTGTTARNGWEAVHCFRNLLWPLGGIMQADGEGFSNEDGYHILWQFSNHVKGPWWMGVLHDGKWIHFQMQLGNKKQREAFLRGEVPLGAKFADGK